MNPALTIVERCIENSKGLFKELEGEFYPFGFVRFHDGSVCPYYLKRENEFPDCDSLLKDLISNLYLDINSKKFKEVATCAITFRVFDNVHYDFLDIKIMTEEGIQKDYCVIIDPDYTSNTFEILETMEFNGTFAVIAKMNLQAE